MSSEFGSGDRNRHATTRAQAPPASRWRAKAIWAAVPILAVMALVAVIHAKRVDPNKPARPTDVVAAPAQPESDAAPPVATPVDEAHALAACHPHLIHAPQAVPQVDTINMPAPGQAHMKIHLWVNGGGLVVRSQFVSGELGSAVEREAAVAYMRGLDFAVPDNGDCRRREIELISDVFEAPTSQGDWVTLVKVHPRYTLDRNGNLRTED